MLTIPTCFSANSGANNRKHPQWPPPQASASLPHTAPHPHSSCLPRTCKENGENDSTQHNKTEAEIKKNRGSSPPKYEFFHRLSPPPKISQPKGSESSGAAPSPPLLTRMCTNDTDHGTKQARLDTCERLTNLDVGSQHHPLNKAFSPHFLFRVHDPFVSLPWPEGLALSTQDAVQP